MGSIRGWLKASGIYRRLRRTEQTPTPSVSPGVAQLTDNDREARQTMSLLADKLSRE